ncbi:metal ABC transporter ATP-binding protein [Slackia exigua]|uniref:metal ABC transporter ATP-binding protein n=1 Tax=Slackia exigua TaxID=84109 RepID=UPI0023F51016|nr:metal ABC transporter ATP-binding protein [Slackia exigua]
MIESLDKPVVFDDVTFSYRETDVLRGVSFSIEAGEMRALVGDNGAGKSTIARIIVGEAPPRSGVARLFGVAPERFEDWARIGYVSQLAPTAIGRFPATVLELVRASQHASMPRFRPAPRSFRDAALSALDAVDMAPFSKRLIRELSGGQLQRVRLACALVGAPDLLVLDEPVNGLDKESRAKFYGLVRRAHDEAGIAVFLITHDLDALPSLGCSVMRLEEGVVEDGGAGGAVGAASRADAAAGGSPAGEEDLADEPLACEAETAAGTDVSSKEAR